MNFLRAVRDALVAALALFAGLNVLFGLIDPAIDGNWLWIGWAGGRPVHIVTLLTAFSLAVLLWSRLPRLIQWPVRALVATIAVGSAIDIVGYYQVLFAEEIQATVPVPLSVLTLLLTVSWAIWPPSQKHRGQWITVFVGLGVWVALLIGSLATTNYARRADAIVVFGARVYADGTPSMALYDRVRTACLLYHRGLATTLVMSGGKADDAPISEPEAMRRIAIAHGIPPTAIVLDTKGINTRASVNQAVKLSKKHGWTRLLMVSHDYHCARIKLACARRNLQVYTVPAVETHMLAKRPLFFVRELAAWGWYWVRPVLEG